MPVAKKTFKLDLPPGLKPKHQLNIYVKTQDGKPLAGAVARLHRALTVPPFASLVGEKITDKDGYVWWDGLWPWSYAVEIIHEEKDLSAEPIIFTISPTELTKTFTFTVIARPPPHLYELRVNLLLKPVAKLSAWLANNLPKLVEDIVGAGGKFDKAWAEDGWLVIRFRIEHSPGWLAVALAILAILVVLGIITWEIREIVPKVPRYAWYLFGIGLAGVGIATAVYAIKRRY